MQVHPVALQWVAPMQGEGEEKEWFRPMRDFSDPMIGFCVCSRCVNNDPFLVQLLPSAALAQGREQKYRNIDWIRLAVMGGTGYSENGSITLEFELPSSNFAFLLLRGHRHAVFSERVCYLAKFPKI